jgi:hypothetical protein
MLEAAGKTKAPRFLEPEYSGKDPGGQTPT